MKNIRIIPRLDIKGPNLVKGIHLEGLRVLGAPADFAKFYYQAGADELIFQDVVASLYERNSLQDIISTVAQEIFIPLTVGGGLRSISDINKVLRAGADKVALNTAVINSPSLIQESSERFGASTIVVAIECIKESDGTYKAYTDNGREYTGIDVFQWAKQAEELGAGEILLTSVDNEGTGSGFDVELVKKVAESVSIPVIAHGGAGSAEDVVKVVQEGAADAVSIASILHYDYIKNNKSDAATTEEGNVSFIKSGRTFNNFNTCSLEAVKSTLQENNINCRI